MRRGKPSCFETPHTQVGFTRLARLKVPISGKPEIGVRLLSIRATKDRAIVMDSAHSNSCDRAGENARYTQNANRDEQNGDQ
jgi:hypothetical protein